VATLLFLTYRQSGIAVLMVMVPLLLMLLVSLHFYFRQQEATEAMREAHAEAADREAALVARESAAAERHLQELRASERRFHAAFSHASIGMALLDFDGRVLQANLALRHLLDRPDEALVGHAFGEFMQADDRSALESELTHARSDGFQGFAREMRCVGREGDEIWASLHCSFFTEPGRAPRA
jgi:PAS domain S-box-containing protein